ncbi:MAG TPA: SDR family oxidoreductase [Gaiellaceae bacterium]|jgi:NAD(P)-dependent dehydrogenase (short-subunit alcohol dehydrogenase family)|nr:SDR family oxidoreductase [Gaiellaceae bacterium]
MDLGLSGKVVAITGGASGIGRATAHAFVHEGARVTVLDRNRDALAELRHELEGIETRQLDVTSAGEVDAAFDAIAEREGRIDVGVNNAGISRGLAWLHQGDEHDFDAVLSVNLKGVWLCMRAELRHMYAQGAGAIVNTASAAGLVGTPGVAHYAASKFGVLGLTKSAALEYASLGIRINAVAPGTIRTPMGDHFGEERRSDPFADAIVRHEHPLAQGIGRADQVADAILYLASDRADFATGSTLVVDGGFTAQ